jgi:hypothetical protein
MRRLHNTTGKVAIGLAMLVIGGSVLQAQTDTTYTSGFSCAGYTGCPASGLVKLKFTPRSRADTVNWLNRVMANAPGTMVGTLTNVDVYAFGPLDIAANGGKAGLWVGQIGPDPVKDRGFGIYKLDSHGNRVGQPWWKKTADQITYCQPPSSTPNPSPRTRPAIHTKDTAHEMGWNCAPLVPAANAQSSSSNSPNYHGMSLVSAPRRIQGISPLWISCSGGCCDIGAM